MDKAEWDGMGWGNDDLLFSFTQGDFSGLRQINKRCGATCRMSLIALGMNESSDDVVISA